ncbi:MAG TPA: HD domain-containing protein [Candidatus Limnocylindrales bacterium]|nr:HD domain-containing protein [Candidatus Limnocylindrales bacterium]
MDERAIGLPPVGPDAAAPGRRLPFAAVNLISDPIHGYVELTKRLSPADARAAGLAEEDVAEDDLLDTAWVQRLRRISQLQSARWVFPTAEHSRFTHGLGVMHEAGLWARSLYPSLRASLPALAPGEPVPSEGLVVETLRIAGLLHDVGHGPFAHFFDDRFLASFPAPSDPRRPGAKRLSHEDLSQLVIERELAPIIRGLRRAPGAVADRDRFAEGETIDPRWVSFLISKPPLVDGSMPGWVRTLQPLLSGVFTVDNLDYVRRDAYLTGVSMGPVDAERLRRYCFVSDRGLTLYESGLGALEMFLTARLFMYQHVYLHRTVRAIDLDLEEVFAPSIRAVFGDGSPAERLGAFADLDEYALLHQAAAWARGEHLSRDPAPGDGRVTPEIADGWRAILLRRPRWRSEREVSREAPTDTWPADLLEALGEPEPGRVVVDLTGVDARPGASKPPTLALERRDGGAGPSLWEALGRVPAWLLIGRRYRRIE